MQLATCHVYFQEFSKKVKCPNSKRVERRLSSLSGFVANDTLVYLEELTDYENG